MNREGRIHKGVSIGAYSILIAFMLLLLWTVLRYPGNHLIPWQMALGVAAATVLLLAAGAAWNKIYTVTGRRNSLYAVALVLFLGAGRGMRILCWITPMSIGMP